MLKIEDPSNKMFDELRSINDQQKDFLAGMRSKANEMLEYLEQLPHGRRKSIALTKLEECILFANKAATFGE